MHWSLFRYIKKIYAKSDLFWFHPRMPRYLISVYFFFSWSALITMGVCCPSVREDGVGCHWDGGGRCQRCLSLLPWASHPVALCPDAGQRRHRRSGPHRGRGSWGGAQQGVPCRSTSSTGQYRSAWAAPPLLSPIIPSMLMTKRKMHPHTVYDTVQSFIKYLSGAKHLKEPNSDPFEQTEMWIEWERNQFSLYSHCPDPKKGFIFSCDSLFKNQLNRFYRFFLYYLIMFLLLS